jgi:hypothetical protein
LQVKELIAATPKLSQASLAKLIGIPASSFGDWMKCNTTQKQALKLDTKVIHLSTQLPQQVYDGLEIVCGILELRETQMDNISSV